MSYILKQGKNQAEVKQSDEKVRNIVSETIQNIENYGDQTLRELSIKFDNWNPDSFRLTDKQIQNIVSNIPKQVKDDIAFAQNNIQRFAKAQKESLKDFEIENIPGVILGQKNIPVESVGCYIPGGRYPMIASAHMSILTAKTAGVKRVIACTPPIDGAIPETTVYAMYKAGADEIYIRWYTGNGWNGNWYRDN